MTPLAAMLAENEAALNTRDARRLAACFGRYFMHMSRHQRGWSHRWRRRDDEFERGLRRALLFYQSVGAARFEHTAVVEGALQPAHALAKVTWRVVTRNGAELVTLDASYVVRTRHDQAEIVAMADHGERARLLERGIRARPGCLLFDLPAQDGAERESASISAPVPLAELFAALERRPSGGNQH